MGIKCPPGVRLPTVTRTVAFTDLANYTARVARSDREGLRRLLGEHEAIVGPTVARYGGRVVKNLGDSFMIIFDAATDALKAAFEARYAYQPPRSLSAMLPTRAERAANSALRPCARRGRKCLAARAGPTQLTLRLLPREAASRARQVFSGCSPASNP